jgi:general secretion pathway protein C
MQTLAHSIWWPRGASFVLAALAAGSASFWALRVSAVNMSTSVPPAAMSGAVEIDAMSVTRALGGGPAPAVAPLASLSSRFVMVGVVADQRAAGAALIAIDGRPAKPFRVGDVVEDGLILQSVRGRTAALGTAMGAAAAVSLELPPLKQ